MWPILLLAAFTASRAAGTSGGTEAASRPAGSGEMAVAVIVHPDLGVDDLSFPELRRIYLGDRQFWPGEVRVTLLVPASGSREREVLLRRLYERSEPQYRHYWIAKVFRTEAVGAPKTASSVEMAARLVRAIPGAVALVGASGIPPGVKVLSIDGKSPGDGGYPLR